MERSEAKGCVFWQNNDFIAFLSNRPNTVGVSVVIPKEHYGSNVTELPEEIFRELFSAAKKVSLLLSQVEGVGRCAIVYEGFEIDHAHVKIFPMHGTADTKSEWRPITSGKSQKTYYEEYPGYISTHNGPLAEEESLRELCEKLSSFAANDKSPQNHYNQDIC